MEFPVFGPVSRSVPAAEPAGELRPIPAQLPADVSAFTGRAAELSELDGLRAGTDRPGAATAVVISAVSGTAGVGKTALAVRWAHRVRAEFPDGQLYVDLHGYDPDRPVPATDALAGFLAALGVAGQDIPVNLDERATRFRTEVSGRRLLVVLDNATSAEQVRPLLPGSPSCLVVVTSRDSLAGLVARHGARRLDLDLLPAADAIELLRRLVGPRVDAEPAAAATLAGQCAQLPLALRVAAELATARPGTPLAQLVAELADQQHRLDLLDAGGDVRAVLSWSYRHLPADAAAVFRLLGLHPGLDVDPYAAAALTGTDLDHVGRMLDTLTRAHLVQPAGPGRYGWHDLLRAYARQLADTGEAEADRRAALTRLFDHCLASAAAAMDLLYPGDQRRPPVPPVPPLPGSTIPPLADPAAARAWLDAERPTLVAVCVHAARYGWASHATRLATTLYRYLDTGGHHTDALTVHTHADEAARTTGDRAAEAQALTGLGLVDWRRGRYAPAADRYQQALDRFREAGDPIGEGRALGNLGNAYLRLGRYAAAVEHHRLALALHRRLGERVGEARALNNLGMVETRLGRHREATEHYQQALRLFGELGDQLGVAFTRNGLGLICQRLDRPGLAADHYRHALRLFAEVGSPEGQAKALAGLADIDVRLGRYAAAADRYQQALRQFREIGDRIGEAAALDGLGEARHGAGRPAEAVAEHTAALALAVEIGERDEQARAHSGLARAHRAVDDVPRAREHWLHALTLYTDLGVPDADAIRARLAELDRPGAGTG